MANLSIKAANHYSADGQIETTFTVVSASFGGDVEISNISVKELRELSGLISNVLADTTTTHNAATVRAYNARRRANTINK